MTVFGKPLSEYVRFQKVVLLVVAAVGLLRLVLSLAGMPNDAVRWVSMTVVGLAAVVYYGVRVHQTGFGSYKHLLPLVVIQNLVAHGIAIVAILLTIAGMPNIYSAPEYGGAMNQWGHALAHLVLGVGVGSLIGWGIASLTLLITRKVSRRPAQSVTA